MSTGRGEELGVLKPSVYHTALVRFLLRLNLNLEKEEKGSVLKKKKKMTLSVTYHTPVIPPTGRLGNLLTAMGVFVDNY